MIYRSLFGILLTVSLVGCGPNVQEGVSAYKAKKFDVAAAILQKNDNDGEALYYLYEMTKEGHGMSENRPLALDYLRKSVSKDYPKALAEFGNRLLRKSSDLVQDTEQAQRYLKKAIEAGNLEANAYLGSYLMGEGNKKELGLVHLFAAESTWQGKLELARFYEDGIDVIKPDPKKAFKYRQELSDLKDIPDVIHYINIPDLAEFYYYGFGVTKDPFKAIKILEPEIAKNESAKSLYAWLLYRGEGVAADPTKAVQLWLTPPSNPKKSIDFNEHYKNAGLAIAYSTGIGIPVDKQKSFFHLKKTTPWQAGTYIRTIMHAQQVAGVDCESSIHIYSQARPVDRYISIAGEAHREHARCLFEKIKKHNKKNNVSGGYKTWEEFEMWRSLEHAVFLSTPEITPLYLEIKTWESKKGE